MAFSEQSKKLSPSFPSPKDDEPNETSPIRNDFRMKIPQGSGATSFNRTDESGEYHPETISYATWSARTWTKWNKATRFLVLVLGLTLIIVAIVLIASISLPNSEENNGVKTLGVVLEIPQGRLTWRTLISRGNREYYAFYKVPYAKPPIGELRFEPPQPPEKWEGIRDEREVAPQCLQKAKYSPIIEAVGDEDCLYMNIYTPRLPGIDLASDAPLLPTLFYIHGGGFSDGNGSRYGGKYFMDQDAVLITFQYRLGIFGFLSSEDGTIVGNMGMKDQVQALKWTKENIRYFGGDPDRIMIFGNSAGGMSVNQLMVSPMTAGLFERAITQSGPTFNAIVQPQDAQLKSYEALATEAGCWSRLNNEQRRNNRVLKCLREQNASDIAVIRGPDIIFATTVETYETDNETEKFLPDTMYNLYKTGNVNKVPWLIGVNSAEWVSIAAANLKDPELVNNLNTNWTGYAPTMFMSPLIDSPIKDEISDKSREFYFGTNPISNETLRNLTNILSDRDIIHGSHTQGTFMSEFGVNVFFYYMSKRPLKSYSDSKALAGYPPADYGASHADELQYLFDYYGYPEYLEGSEYFEFSKKLVRIWVEFAATANPGWDPIAKDQTAQWYELNDRMGPTPLLHERMKFWDQFSPEELCFD